MRTGKVERAAGQAPDRLVKNSVFRRPVSGTGNVPASIKHASA
jgi:hypothetical protein